MYIPRQVVDEFPKSWYFHFDTIFERVKQTIRWSISPDRNLYWCGIQDGVQDVAEF